MALTTERQRIQHLLRRAGFGYNASELDEYVLIGLKASVERLLSPERVDDRAADEALAGLRAKASEDRGALTAWWQMRMVLSRRPLLEKLTFYWHDHWATGIRKVNNPAFMLAQNDTIRAGALGRFSDLALAITRDPAMMVWLDSTSNIVRAPNENYARELMELFTLGEGNGYTEKDVYEAARALTGWRILQDKPTTEVRFPAATGVALTRSQHDTGIKTVLGVTGHFADETVVDIVTSRRECAEYLGRRLWQFFAVPEPTAEMVERTTRVYFESDTCVRDMLRVILTSEEMYSDAAYRWRIKSPVEYITQALRSLDLSDRAGQAMREQRVQGQVLFDPPSPAGWDWGEAWINSNTLLARANFANNITLRGKPGQTVDVAAWLRERRATGSAAAAVDAVLDLVVGGDVDAGTRALLMDHIGGPLHYDFAQASKSGALQGLLYLALTMPVAHLA
ncbi:MAG: DUF1800 domain-containing protein [Dehalococcoidia bacterium]|nr:DUF1800 domain-containing protein [Dehalococcoidia bacterium]